MTWLRGQTTWGELLPKLTALACGEVGDDFGAQVPAVDRWVRDWPTTNNEHFLRAPAANDYTPPTMKNRAGYWNLTSYRWGYGALAFSSDQLIPNLVTTTVRQTGLPTLLTTVFTALKVTVVTANTVAGNYSNATYSYEVYDLSVTNGSGVTSGNSIGINAAGDATSSGAISYHGGIRFSDPSGFLQVGAEFTRVFTPEFRAGIDGMGPETWRRTTTPVFSVNPPGTQTTDWAYTEVHPGANANNVGGNLNLWAGVGHKTAATCTGAVYEFTYPMAMTKVRLSAATAGVIQATFGGIFKTAANTYLTYGNSVETHANWLRSHTTSTSVTSGSLVQYWLSVKGGGLKIVLNADPGQTGISTCNWIAPATRVATPAAKDPFNFVWGDDATNFLIASSSREAWTCRAAHSAYSALKRTDGSEGRDWQTGWARSDMFSSTSIGPGTATATDGLAEWARHVQKTLFVLGIQGDKGSSDNVQADMLPAVTTKPSIFDGSWWLGSIVLTEVLNTTQSVMPAQSFYPRFSLGDKIYYLPGGGWQNGDELTETATGKKYFLLATDHHGIFGRVRQANNAFTGGVALLEE